MKPTKCIVLLLFVPTFLFGQLSKTTIKFKDITVECYKYKLEKDTILLAYFDQSVRSISKSYESNLGKRKTDATFDSIADFIRDKFPKEKSTIYKTATNVKLTDFKPNTTSPGDRFSKSYNHFWIGAINYYGALLENKQLTDTNYYELANALIYFHGTFMPWNNDKAISYLDSCINFNKNHYLAYILKAKIQVQNAIWKGKLSAEPHVDVIDAVELNKAAATIKFVLQNNRSKAALAVYDEINKLKKKYNSYDYH